MEYEHSTNKFEVSNLVKYKLSYNSYINKSNSFFFSTSISMQFKIFDIKINYEK